jgi:hypothetical protein
MIDIAFYTCYLGPSDSWSNKVYSPPSSEHPCYYFTNNETTFATATSAGWTAIWMDIPLETDEIRTCQATKLLRCCPHLFEPLVRHTHLCYLDSKLWVTDLESLLAAAGELTPETPLVMSRHPIAYSSVWGEFEEAMKQPRYSRTKETYKRYIEQCLRTGFQDIPLRHCCGFRIQLCCPLARQIGESWYAHIGACGIEDQISWQFVVQQFPGAVCEIPYKTYWNAL